MIEGLVRAFLINLSFAGISTALTASTSLDTIAVFTCINFLFGFVTAIALKDRYDSVESLEKAPQIKRLLWIGLIIYIGTVAVFAFLGDHQFSADKKSPAIKYRWQQSAMFAFSDPELWVRKRPQAKCFPLRLRPAIATDFRSEPFIWQCD